MLNSQSIDINARARFQQRALAGFHQSDFMYNHIMQRLFSHLEDCSIGPETILNYSFMGSIAQQKLAELYPKATIVSINNPAELSQLTPYSFDMLVAHGGLHQVEDVMAWLMTLRACLKSEGLLLLSCLGPDTFQELRAAFAAASVDAHLDDFVDLHHVGDMLLQSGFAEPVVDVERLHINYKSLAQLFMDLKNNGCQNVHLQRLRHVMPKGRWQAMLNHYPQLKGESNFSVSIEANYALAWAGDVVQQQQDHETYISFDNIQRKGA